MGTLRPKYLLYGYMEPLGKGNLQQTDPTAIYISWAFHEITLQGVLLMEITR